MLFRSKLIVSIAALSIPVFAGSARAQEFRGDVGSCALGSLIVGGIASIAGKSPGGYAALGCGAGALVGRQYPQQYIPEYQPAYQPPPVNYRYRSEYQRQNVLTIPSACEKYRNDQELLISCAQAYASEQSRMEEQARYAAEEQRRARIRSIQEEGRRAAHEGY